MPARSPSSRRYAQAVFDLADEEERFIAWARDLETISAFVHEADVAKVLASARVPRAEKLRLLAAGLDGQVSGEALNLVRILADRDKLALVSDVEEVFLEMVDKRRGIAHAVVTTAVPLSDDERTAVAERLSAITGKTVDVTPAVDPEIIGGIVARIVDELIDGSTSARLVALKRSLEGVAR